MAGVVTQSAGLVRQKAYNAVYGGGTRAALDGVVRPIQSPYSFYAIKSFFLHWAANKGNLDLQFIPYTDAQQTTANGYQPLAAGAATVYVWYMIAHRTTGTTAAFQELVDDADDNTSTTVITAQRINAAGQEAIFVWPNGFPFATEITITSVTAIGGGTSSTATHGTDGFLIVGV